MKQAIHESLVLTWEMEWCSLDITCRSSHQRRLVKIDVLGNFAKFKGKHFIKKEGLAQVFSVNFAKFLITPFPQNTSGCLLLNIVMHYHFFEIFMFAAAWLFQFGWQKGLYCFCWDYQGKVCLRRSSSVFGTTI